MGSARANLADRTERRAVRQRLEACKLAGIITLALGLAMMAFIKAVDAGNVAPSYLVGLLPVSVGLSLLLYVYVLASRERLGPVARF